MNECVHGVGKAPSVDVAQGNVKIIVSQCNDANKDSIEK